MYKTVSFLHAASDGLCIYMYIGAVNSIILIPLQISSVDKSQIQLCPHSWYNFSEYFSIRICISTSSFTHFVLCVVLSKLHS